MPHDKKDSILVVDDDLIVTDMISGALKDVYRVEVANYGAQAVSRANELLPDLILLDVLLTDAQGYDICRQLKSDPGTEKIPVIFISSFSEPFNKIKGFDAGGVDYVTKPIEILELKMRINTHITLSRLQRDLECGVPDRSGEPENAEAALRAALERRETEIRAMEETLRSRIDERIRPCLDKLEQLGPGKEGIACLEILRSSLDELMEWFQTGCEAPGSRPND